MQSIIQFNGLSHDLRTSGRKKVFGKLPSRSEVFGWASCQPSDCLTSVLVMLESPSTIGLPCCIATSHLLQKKWPILKINIWNIFALLFSIANKQLYESSRTLKVVFSWTASQLRRYTACVCDEITDLVLFMITQGLECFITSACPPSHSMTYQTAPKQKLTVSKPLSLKCFFFFLNLKSLRSQ